MYLQTRQGLPQELLPVLAPVAALAAKVVERNRDSPPFGDYPGTPVRHHRLEVLLPRRDGPDTAVATRLKSPPYCDPPVLIVRAGAGEATCLDLELTGQPA